MLDLGGITRVRLGFKVEEFRENEPVVNWPIREVAGCLMLLANETRPDTASSVRAVASAATAPSLAHDLVDEGDKWTAMESARLLNGAGAPAARKAKWVAHRSSTACDLASCPLASLAVGRFGSIWEAWRASREATLSGF